MKFRFARHTNNLEELKNFYIAILGFDHLGGFENHNDYDGIFIGKLNLDWHLEFTKSKELVTFDFGEEDYLVFYPETMEEFETIEKKLIENDCTFISSKNPYWNETAIIVKDPDGYSVIISKKTQ